MLMRGFERIWGSPHASERLRRRPGGVRIPLTRRATGIRMKPPVSSPSRPGTWRGWPGATVSTISLIYWRWRSSRRRNICGWGAEGSCL